MGIQMTQLPIKRVFIDSRTANEDGNYEFTIDCGAVYFGAAYDNDGSLLAVDQYFYTDSCSQNDLERAVNGKDLLSVDIKDYPVKTYLLNKHERGNEWLRFHAVVPQDVDPDYFHQKYIGE